MISLINVKKKECAYASTIHVLFFAVMKKKCTLYIFIIEITKFQASNLCSRKR